MFLNKKTIFKIMKEKISVVIPILNESSVIKNCLKHLLVQKETPFDVIVVDNGSIDNGRKIADSLKILFAKKGIILKTFYYPIGNQVNARDFGTRKAGGEIICFLDADAFADSMILLPLEFMIGSVGYISQVEQSRKAQELNKKSIFEP